MRRGAVLAALALTGAAAFSQARIPTTQVRRIAIPDSPIPSTAKARKLGAVKSTDAIQVVLGLQPRDLAGLQQFCDAVSDPTSPLYQQFLTPAQVGDRFGASASDKQAVVDYLASKGLTVTLISPNGMGLVAEGSAANVQNAFGTTLANYIGPDEDGKTINFRANVETATLPAEIPNVVTCIAGLEDYHRFKRRGTTLAPAQASVLYSIQPSKNNGYYGQGRNVAISNFDGFSLANVPYFINQFGLPFPTSGRGSNISVITINGGSQGSTAQGEGDLDIQMVLGQAPLANIVIYDGPNSVAGGLAVLMREASDNTMDILTESYGDNFGTAVWTTSHNYHLAMTAQGQTYMAASGDSGTTIRTGPYPDIDPDVLMVGGSVATTDNAGNRSSEIGWTYGGGGWYNDATPFNVLPAYQKGVGVPTNVNRRLVPDIASHAAGDNTSAGTIPAYYFAYGGAGSFYGGDGTSFASPIVAGQLATLESRLFGNASNPSGGRLRLGRLQDFIYGQNATSVLGSVYYDITTGSNGKLPNTTTGTSNTLSGATSNATVGWDFVTGWGAINFEGFYQSLLAVVPTRMTVAVTFGNFVGDVTTVPVVVQYRTPGTMTVVGSQTVYPAANGSLVLSAPSAGTYDVSLKASHWLRRTLAGQVFTTGSTLDASTNFINGDANGDNQVSAGDLAKIQLALGTSNGDSGYNPAADLNGDGFISAGDLAIAVLRLGQIGDN